MKNNISIDYLLNKIHKLTARETAVTLSLLRQNDPSIVLTRDNNYFIKMLNDTHIDWDRLLVLLNNISSILVPENDLE